MYVCLVGGPLACAVLAVEGEAPSSSQLKVA